MSLSTLFSIANTTALLAWILIIAAPLRWRVASRVAVGVALLLAAAYATLIGVFMREGQGGFGTLDGVARLFEHPGILLAGWIHYLAFDLLVGLWERHEAERVGMSRWILVVCQILTFMVGPIGWLLFMAMRALKGRTTPAAGAQGAMVDV